MVTRLTYSDQANRRKEMYLFKSFVVVLIFLAMSVITQAQVVDKKTLTLDGAKKVIAAAVTEAKKNNSGGVIAIVDDGGNLMALERLDGTFPAGANISIGKARTAAIFNRPTSGFEDIIKNGRTAMVALSDFTPLQGGVPIRFDGQIVGAIGISGATSAQEDTAIATAGGQCAYGFKNKYKRGSVLFRCHIYRKQKSG